MTQMFDNLIDAAHHWVADAKLPGHARLTVDDRPIES